MQQSYLFQLQVGANVAKSCNVGTGFGPTNPRSNAATVTENKGGAG